ncbi:MAG: hypothetical protein IPL16_11645 [Ignavibacteria bacterium]|nr:hypothetical protein [Ignavibacteria bacterium]
MCEIENSKISPINENNLKIDWADFSKYWVEIVFWIIREARDDQELERFNHWIEKLKILNL